MQDLQVPDNLHQRDLPLVSLTESTLLYRIQPEEHSSPLHFGCTGNNRWDCPGDTLPSFGVLYTAVSAKGAFYETLGHNITQQIFSDAELRERTVHVLTPRTVLELVDLTGDGLAQLQVDIRLTSTRALSLPQSWARAIHDHPSTPAGIRYVSRHQPALHCVALFDRTAELLEATSNVNLMYWQDADGSSAVDYIEARGGFLVSEY